MSHLRTDLQCLAQTLRLLSFTNHVCSRLGRVSIFGVSNTGKKQLYFLSRAGVVLDCVGWQGWQTHFLILTLAQTTNFIVFVSAMPREEPKSTLDDLLQAPEGQIRVVLRALCHDTQVRNSALGHLDNLKILDDVKSKFSGSAATKRKAEDQILICVQCDAAFFEKSNDKESCHYHWGKRSTLFLQTGLIEVV